MKIKKLLENINKLLDQAKFREIIDLLSDEKLSKMSHADSKEFYIWRGNMWYNLKETEMALKDYNKVIELDSLSALAYYNRGFVWVVKQDYNKAIEDYRKAISIDSSYASAYVIKASILRALRKYDNAIEDYDVAISIDPNYANAYYNRGLAKKEHNVDLESSKEDFERYLELTADETDIWTKYAHYYIHKLNERINDKELSSIINLIEKIKEALLFNDNCITHYTSLSVLQNLILKNSKFRISEGNFMNDPSEGQVFFNYLEYSPYLISKNGLRNQIFSAKPFIGSFVTKDKYDDLNMWRFYGKEAGEEAKGCAITLDAKLFIEDVHTALPKGEEDFLEYESDINFYWVAYSQANTSEFEIPDLNKKEKLNKLMAELKIMVCDYKKQDRTSLEYYLNSLAFLFKSDAYKNENEVRLVVKGIEFEKKHNFNMTPPRIYIELESIKHTLKQITFGPKVEKVNEWAASFHYSYDSSPPHIVISNLPYQ